MSSDTQKVVAHLSRSVQRDCSLSVSVCPTVPAIVLTRKTSDREVGMAPPSRHQKEEPFIPWINRRGFLARSL